MSALLSGSKDLITCPRCRVNCGNCHGWPPQRTWPRCLGRRKDSSQRIPIVLPAYQIRLSLYSLSIHIYDSLNLIV